MALKIGIIADTHLGPLAYHKGELRKMGNASEALTEAFVEAMNTHYKPDLILNLGDMIQEVGDVALDLSRYQRIFDILSGLDAPIWPVVGNHDLISLHAEQLLPLWHRQTAFGSLKPEQRGGDGLLYYHFQASGFDFVVLHSHEERTKYIWIDEPQIRWLEQTLSKLTGPVVIVMHHTLAEDDTSGNVWFKNAPHLALVREREQIRAILADSGKVVAVLNGHLHHNDLTWHDHIPYVTVQSIVENVTGGAEGKACAAWGKAALTPERLQLEIVGFDPVSWDVTLGQGNR